MGLLDLTGFAIESDFEIQRNNPVDRVAQFPEVAAPSAPWHATDDKRIEADTALVATNRIRRAFPTANPVLQDDYRRSCCDTYPLELLINQLYFSIVLMVIIIDIFCDLSQSNQIY
ncbi:hypothetical protein OZX67_08370 [Bifidobacterium sp. ESL0728]|uniref:hypothetical protein n=1 Tax=Bifidobacterium sp. ESL0728 TaxID=2983220 RepID=UPI0023F83C2D|nr:hypothetical protein [Bifidobacterium sp. ESL0728]WEV58791.1 hypothetical protein OZX67_08370 [Bifidobacterium sp. ESL0728]